MYYHSPDVLAYSPDGCSLAGCFGSVITIWDIQTGGVVGEIEHGVKGILPKLLAWLSDGTVIGVIFPVGKTTWTIAAYHVASGREAYATTFKSLVQPYLWPLHNSLQAMVLLPEKGHFNFVINILKIWPLSTNHVIGSFPVELNSFNSPLVLAFSPSTYQICTTNRTTLSVINIRNSKVLLQQSGYFTQEHFSPDGRLLVAHNSHCGACIWKYTPEQGYSLWKEFPSWNAAGCDPLDYRFSPASSSVLSSRPHFFEVQHLNLGADPPTGLTNHYDEFSPNGTYVVAAPEFGSTITITNLHKNSSQFLNTGFKICGLVLTGDVLLVGGADAVAAWRLTAEGVVDRLIGEMSDENNGKLWTKTVEDGSVRVGADDGIGVIEFSEGCIYYDTETGEELKSVPDEAPSPWRWTHICNDDGNRDSVGYSLSNYDFLDATCNHALEDPPPVPVPRYREGWVEFPGGEHRHLFWLPAHWRPRWGDARWFDGISTLRLDTTSGLVIIKF